MAALVLFGVELVRIACGDAELDRIFIGRGDRDADQHSKGERPKERDGAAEPETSARACLRRRLRAQGQHKRAGARGHGCEV